MNKVGFKLLSKSEQAIAKGSKKGYADLLAEGSVIKGTLTKMLGVEISDTLEDGTEINATAIDMIVAATIADAYENPSTTKLKDLTAIMGELKEKVDIQSNLSKVDEDLQARAIVRK